MSETLVKTGSASEPQSFDDVMLAMDVVDTLRHRESVLDKELSAEQREEKLIERLRVIYKNQGIEVPDRILRDGVKALEEKRFVYEPPQDGFGIRLAKFYIARDRWLKPFALVMGLAAFGTATYHFGVEAPKQREAQAIEVELSQTLPAQLELAFERATKVAETDAARTKIETIYQDGMLALDRRDTDTANEAITAINTLTDDLQQDLTLRVISRPGEMSGVFRIHDDDATIKNYYLIVEAVDARGRTQPLQISSEEDQTTRRVEKWGIRVTEGEFNRIAADKQDDQIIQNAEIGQKPRGSLTFNYTIDTAGGAILDW